MDALFVVVSSSSVTFPDVLPPQAAGELQQLQQQLATLRVSTRTTVVAVISSSPVVCIFIHHCRLLVSCNSCSSS
jgi:hypothetical protein